MEEIQVRGDDSKLVNSKPPNMREEDIEEEKSDYRASGKMG